jgi:hypothetical protein
MKWMAAAILAVLPVGAAYATEGVVVGDAYVNSAHPAVNYGSLSNLYVNGNGTALLQFDLSALPAGTTASQIGSATLKLYVNRVNTSGTVNVVPVTSAWSESAVTYNTIPSLGSTVASFTPATAGQYVVIDVTSLVQEWVTTPSSNFGLALTTSSGDVVLDSKENDETSHVAHLDITVVSQGPAGPAGADGAQGPTGPAGPVGATGATGAAGANGVVQGITASYSNTAAVGAGTASIGGTAANPVVNVNFPNGIQSITASASNSALAGNGTASIGGTAANPVVNINFPYDVQSISVGTVTNSGTTGTLSLVGTATNPVITANFPASSGSSGFTWLSSYQNETVTGPFFTAPAGGSQVQYYSQLAFSSVPSACTVKSLQVYGIVTNNPQSGTDPEAETVAFTVYRNDSAQSMTCSVSTTASVGNTGSCSDTTHTFAVTPGQRLSIGTTENVNDNNHYSTVGYSIILTCQ